MTLYVRYQARLVAGKPLFPILVLADMHAEVPGSGNLRRLLARLTELRPDLHLFFENVMNDRLATFLSRQGFEMAQPGCFVLRRPAIVE